MKRLPIVCFLLVPVLILSANKLFAQSLFDRGVPLFEHAFSLYESGNTFTIAITQDQQGKIWIGGRYGLKFYTGQRFVDVKKVAGQHLAGVRSLYVDEQNSIWIGTPNQGVFVYPQEPDIEPRHYTTENSELAGNYIRSISGDQNGRLWFATETGLSEFSLQNNQFETITLTGFPDSIEQTKVRDLSVANGVLWAGTEAGLGRYETSEIETKSLIFAGLASDISAVDASGGEQIWLGQTDGQVLVLDSKTGIFEKVDVGQLSSLESVFRINDIKRVGDDEIWVITNRSGVIVINTDSYKRNYPASNIRNFRIAHGTFVEGSFLEIIYVDDNNAVWVGGQKGVFLLSKEQRIQRVIDTAVEMTVPLSSNYIGALIELNNKDLLIGQRNGQIAYLPGSPEQKHLPIVEKINDLNLGITIVAMAQVENFLYLGTTDHYLYKIDLKDGVISQFNHANGFPIAHVRAFYTDREERLWIGTDDGLGYLNQDTFTPVYFDNGQRMTSRIHNLQQDASGIIWIATMDGLFALNPDTLIAQHHSISGAAGRMLHTLMVGSDNKLWLAYLNELFKCDIIDIEQISCDAFSQGEPMEFGQNLTAVGEHHIFTENGIIDTQNSSFSPFPNTAFTILKRAYWNTMVRLSDGAIAYGSDIGISVVDPKLVDDSAIDSPIYLEKYYVDANVSAYPMDNQIKLPSSSQNVRIAFNDYQFGEGDVFRYMLKGYDKGWIETYQDVREVSYSHLPPGQFQFLVSKRLGKDLWSPQSQVATLVVIPAWHQQPLVRIASVLLFLLVLYGLYKHRISTLEKRQGMLEAEVEKRTEELRLKNEQLHYKNKEIEHLANHDQLTGLPSLRLADDRLEMAIEHAKRHQNKCALMYLDLDGFKIINDTHGHDAGDVMLKEIAKRFKAEVRGSDTCCRIGGDEFLIILPEAESGASLNTLCQRLVDKTQAPVEFAGKQLHVGVSIGVAFFPDNAKDSSSLRTAADEAMYKVKKSGKNNFTFSQKAC